MRWSLSLWALAVACGPAGTLGGSLPIAESEASSDPVEGKRIEMEEESCTPPVLAALRTDLFIPACGRCHGGAEPAEALDLTLEEVELRMRLMQPASQSPSGMPLISPGSIGASYLFLKVAVETPLIGRRMPRDAEPVENCLEAALRAWIKNGAN